MSVIYIISKNNLAEINGSNLAEINGSNLAGKLLELPHQSSVLSSSLLLDDLDLLLLVDCLRARTPPGDELVPPWSSDGELLFSIECLNKAEDSLTDGLAVECLELSILIVLEFVSNDIAECAWAREFTEGSRSCWFVRSTELAEGPRDRFAISASRRADKSEEAHRSLSQSCQINNMN